MFVVDSKTASFFLVTTLFVAYANGEDNAPQSGYILGGANPDFGVSSHILYVTYPGMDSGIGATMKIENGDDTIHTYTFKDENEIKTPYTFFFAVENAEKYIGYTVKFCNADGLCSKPSSPVTVMDDGKGELDCLELDSTVKNVTIPKVSKYATESEVQDYIALRKKINKVSIADKESISKNPAYKVKQNDKGFMYFLVHYPLSHFKKFFEAQNDDEKYCQRKYTLSVITQVLDKNTKKILKRGRFTPNPFTSEAMITKYITGETTEEVPIEFTMKIKQEEAEKEDLQIWQSVCLSAKDMVSSREDGFATKCSDPLLHEWNYDESVVQAE